MHNSRSRVLVSSSTFVIIHYARVIGDRLCHAWPILPSSRLIRRHPVLVRRLLILYTRVSRRRLFPMQPLRHLVPISITKVQTSRQFRAVLSILSMFDPL